MQVKIRLSVGLKMEGLNIIHKGKLKFTRDTLTVARKYLGFSNYLFRINKCTFLNGISKKCVTEDS